MVARLLAALICAGLAIRPLDAQMSGVKNVFVIVLENHDWSAFKGSSRAPYLNRTLLPQASHAEQYYNPPGIHPSLPNYLWIEAGTNFGVTNDNDPSSNHQSTTSHLVSELAKAGVSWKTYQEDISGTICPLTGVNKYAPKHNPFIYFDDVTDANDPNSAVCINHVRPFAELANDLKTGAIPQYAFLTPNLCNAGHDTCAPQNDPVRQSDDWLSTIVPMILNSKAYQNGGAIFITWDEGELADGPIGLILLSPYAKGGGYSNSIYYNHGSLLRTIEEIFGVALLRDAANQADLSDLFGSAPVLTAGSAANGATYLPGGLVPGSWAVVKGANLSNTTRIWAASDFSGLGDRLPVNLGGVEVNVNNLPAAVYYISAAQINFQVPAGISGTASMQVFVNGVASNTITGETANSAPGIFPVVVNGTNYPAAVFLDGTYVGDPSIGPSFRNARPGEVVVLFATGLAPSPAGVLSSVIGVSGVTVAIGNVTTAADFAGLVAPGEFQINFTVPQQFASMAAGPYPISIQVNGVSSPASINTIPPGPIVIPIQP